MKRIFDYIADSLLFLGLIGGSAVMFIIGGLTSYFILWLIKIWGGLFIEWEWISSEYIKEPFLYVFFENYDTTQIVFVLIFGLTSALKVWYPRNSQ